MTGPAERARLAELARKDDAGKLVLLAAWFDIHDAKSAANGYPSSGDEVQRDLRRIAARLAALEAVASAAGTWAEPAVHVCGYIRNGDDDFTHCALCVRTKALHAALRALDEGSG